GPEQRGLRLRGGGIGGAAPGVGVLLRADPLLRGGADSGLRAAARFAPGTTRGHGGAGSREGADADAGATEGRGPDGAAQGSRAASSRFRAGSGGGGTRSRHQRGPASHRPHRTEKASVL